MFPLKFREEKKDFDAYYIDKGVKRENVLMAHIHVLHKKSFPDSSNQTL